MAQNNVTFICVFKEVTSPFDWYINRERCGRIASSAIKPATKTTLSWIHSFAELK